MFCFSEIFLFGALLGARFALWGNTRPGLSQVLGLITTSVLLLSSFFMNRAESAIANEDRKAFLSGLLATALLGTLFFIGVVVLEWNVFGLELELFGVEWFGHLKPTDGAFGGIFFAMTGMHALHVLSGIIFILIVWNNGRGGHFSADEHWGVEACAIYWHYVDVVWVFFYPALYLIGTAT
jgi:cytochrome c oxidase subunit 3